MNWQTTETHYGLIEELEWPDFWDDYERAVHGFADAHEAPRQRFGIAETDVGRLQQQLRILDPSGTCLARLRRSQESLGKAECALRSKLELLPEEWKSDKAFHRILGVLNLDECSIFSHVVKAFEKMHVDNSSLKDLIALAKSKHGFALAVDAAVRVGTAEARKALLEIASEAKEDEHKKGLLNDAAVALSVKLHDRYVIPVLVNRLIAAYSKSENPSTEPKTIVADLLGVIEHSRDQLAPSLLSQLSRLGGTEADETSHQKAPSSNAKLGIEQAVISRDLRPIRDAAREELQRRERAL